MLKFVTSASLGALAVALAAPASAQDDTAATTERTGGVDAIIVTAQRRSEDLQDVPVSVQALGEKGLEELNINTFTDYLEQLPTVTAGGSGPGQATIYIRGLASTTPNLGTAGVAGLAPNVAFYLDEQPLAQPGRNLDVYAADLERIEVLSGPQGTLFGASSQAGVVRLITNKPRLGAFEASADAGVSFTKGGETSYKAEAMLNVPVTDNFALRGVVFLDDQGGYVDNVHGTRSLRESGRFRTADTVRANGVVVGDRAGFQSDPASLAYIDNEVTFLEADNSALVQDNFNDTQYSGFRVTGLYELTPDWTITVAHTRQSIESDGVFFADPELDGLDDLEIQRFNDDRLEDDFSNTSWTVEGRLGMLELIYTGAYTDRESDQKVAYSDYLFVGQYIPYYSCDTAVAYPSYVAVAPANPTCYAPNFFLNSTTDTTVFTQELRLNTPQDARFRASVGGFYSDLQLDERVDYGYAKDQFVRGSDGVTTGFAPTYPFTNTEFTGETGNAFAGYFSDPGPLPQDIGFRNDVRRTDKQFGIFGEVSFDIVPDVFTITGGARYYDVKVDIVGSATTRFCKLNSPIFGANAGVDPDDQVNVPGCGGGNLSLLFGPDNPFGNPDKAETDGFIFKGTATFTPTPDLLFYATYSEGFRPGLLNRPAGATNPDMTFTVPGAVDTDEVTNYEIGWKTDMLDGQLRLNGSAFFVDVKRLQTTIFDPNITNLFFSDNAANAEIRGIEADFTVAPYSLPGLTVSGAMSLLDTEITELLTPTDTVLVGSDLAYAPSFQGNLRARYEWDLNSDLTMFVMPQVSHSSSKYTDVVEINRLKLDGYTTFDMSAGVVGDMWTFEVYGENLSDERAELAGNFNFDRARITTNRPLTVGMRVSFDY